ncbi:MAG: hypothetical protein Q8N00_01845 [Nitrospirota bacterium]|nr:hypothetical protein [Nitrospirota bacterium]MDP3597681.1 hypothetical protein [Nitrospirota bacterium]
MKLKPNSTVKGSVMALLMALLLWFLPTPAQAAVVTQLDITGGSISLNFGSLGNIAGSFIANGQLLMDQFQPPPNIFDPITISHLTFSIFSSNGGALNLPAPTGQTSGATLTADLQSLFAGVTSTGWGWVNTNPLMASLNIGGDAAGSFNELTNAFDISWTRSFSGVPFLTSGTFTLQGTAQVAAVPLPGALLLFGSGLLGLAGAMRKGLRFV